jgi:anti-anti-sigma factor
MAGQAEPNGIEVQVIGEVAVVRFPHRYLFNDRLLEQVDRELSRLVESQGQRRLVLNFGNVQDMGSRMAAITLMLLKKVVGAGGRLVLCGINPPVREQFHTLMFFDLIDAYEGEDEALRSFP